jgi:hypothetical protein
MNAKRWVVAAVVVGGIVFAQRGCLNQLAPDEKLAEHLEAMCTIARDHVDSPEPGVRALGRYLGRHAGEILGNVGSTIALIERIPDDTKHDERARVARQRIQTPARACEEDWARFNRAVERDPNAKALLERHLRRLNRTLEIVFGKTSFTLRDLPRQLELMF